MKRMFMLMVMTAFMIADANANHWNPDPYQFENSMTVVGVVAIDGVEQTSGNLELGAFCNGEVRGSVMGQYEQTFNRCFFYMMIYGVTNDDISFALYDHSTSEELDVTSLSSVTFSPNAMVGTIIDPYVFSFHDNSLSVTIEMNPTDGGSAIGAGNYYENDTCTIVITPNQGFDFVSITENGNIVSNEPVYTFIVTEDRNLTANFVLQTFDVVLSVNQGVGGMVSGGGTFDYGTEIRVCASPDEGYSFISWKENDSVVCTTPEYSFVVTSDRDLVATFSIDYYTITAEVDPEESGTVTGAGNYVQGSVCNLTAVPNTHYFFDNWTIGDSVVSLEPIYTFTVVEPVMLTAHFHYFDDVEENNCMGIEVYPNPASDKVIIRRTIAAKMTAKIIDISGKTILEKELVSETEIFNISDVEKGAYILVVGEKETKFIVK